MGDLYFGAVSHIEETIYQHKDINPGQRYLLLRMHHVAQCDFSGIHMLEAVLDTYRDSGGDLYLMQVQDAVLEFMKSTGYYDLLGEDHFLTDDDAISTLFYKVLDPATCIYECPVRVFKECQNLPKPTLPVELPAHKDIYLDQCPEIQPSDLWKALHSDNKPIVFDLREQQEFRRGHIIGAHSLPLPRLLSEPESLPSDQEIVFVCRSGRRSRRALAWMMDQGFDQIAILKDGMLGWENAGLLTAVDLPGNEESIS